MTTAAIGVDPGARWTAAVARVGDLAVNGFTLGPTDAHGRLASTALDELGADALARYIVRVGQHLDYLYDLAEDAYGPVMVGVELPNPPRPYRRIPIRDWLATHTLAWAIYARYDGVRLVPPGHHGRRHLAKHGGSGDMAAYYPRELCRRRPAGWMTAEAPRTARDHERAAFDIAGVALAGVAEGRAA